MPHAAEALQDAPPQSMAKDLSLTDIVREIMDQSTLANEDLYDQVTAALLRDGRLHGALLHKIVRAAVRDAVHAVVSQSRSIAAVSPRQPDRNTIAVIAQNAMASVLDFRLNAAITLRQATKADLLELVRRYRAQAETMQMQAAWLEKIAAKLPDGKCVGDVLSEAQCEALRQESARLQSASAKAADA